MYSHGGGKRRAAIIIANNSIGAILITQLSDNDAVLVKYNRGMKHITLPAYIQTTTRQ
jgi:hypothetical protein